MLDSFVHRRSMLFDGDSARKLIVSVSTSAEPRILFSPTFCPCLFRLLHPCSGTRVENHGLQSAWVLDLLLMWPGADTSI